MKRISHFDRVEKFERAAWMRDHPGMVYHEHVCGLSDREYKKRMKWFLTVFVPKLEAKPWRKRWRRANGLTLGKSK